MYLLLLALWIFVGLGAGWLAGKSLEGEGFGRSLDIFMGIGGGILGGVFMRSIGFSGYGGTALATLVAITCAALLTSLTALSNGRKLHTRAL
ncbi:MAG TPA: GlsB/YeaQ/YmgE family stress response membrane protein [Candidatus Dormibacteraeota bacterium]|jgi:uncharacterized membrane protein YeaQ/YmgE (transglycosylase-associated protein family)|nr:GlsB/YeaQ/YmgE family stress response membrane protein [Candidatus Dormibacteraeota bacterium]